MLSGFHLLYYSVLVNICTSSRKGITCSYRDFFYCCHCASNVLLTWGHFLVKLQNMDNSAQLSLRTESTVNSATILPLNCLYFVLMFFLLFFFLTTGHWYNLFISQHKRVEHSGLWPSRPKVSQVSYKYMIIVNRLLFLDV